MDIPDWSRLDPYRPPSEDELAALYVERPEGERVDLAAMVRAGFGGGRIALNGPAGVGKSTELLRAAKALEESHLVVLLPLDQKVDVGQADEGDLLAALAVAVLEAVPTLGAEPEVQRELYLLKGFNVSGAWAPTTWSTSSMMPSRRTPLGRSCCG